MGLALISFLGGVGVPMYLTSQTVQWFNAQPPGNDIAAFAAGMGVVGNVVIAFFGLCFTVVFASLAALLQDTSQIIKINVD